MRNIVGCVRLF